MIEFEIEGAKSFSVHTPLDETIYLEMESWLKPSQVSYAPKRKQDYLAGRYCAKKALEKLSVEVNDIPMHDSRAPIWPSGVVGSITHTKSIAIASVSNKLKGIGIDAETIMDKKRYQNLKKMIVSPSEETIINSNLTIFPTLIFSAKESLYKAIYPQCEKYFGFLDASIKSITESDFTILLHSNDSMVSSFNGEYTGKYKLFESYLVTSIAIKYT